MVKEEGEVWLAAEKTFIRGRMDTGRDGICILTNMSIYYYWLKHNYFQVVEHNL